MQLDSRWLREASKEDKANLENAIRNDSFVLGRLLAILENEYETAQRMDDNEAQFENPNWQYVSAYRAGQRNQLKKVLSLLSFLKE